MTLFKPDVPPAGPDDSDLAYLTVKTVVSLVPVASAVFDYFVQAPATRRRDEFIDDLAADLRRLQEKRESRSRTSRRTRPSSMQ